MPAKADMHLSFAPISKEDIKAAVEIQEELRRIWLIALQQVPFDHKAERFAYNRYADQSARVSALIRLS